MSSDQKKFIAFISFLSILIIGITLITYCLNSLIHYDYFINPKEYIFHTDKLGQFGDFIGGLLGTILTIIATIFIYYTFKSQKRALVIQKKELKSQKKELLLQRKLISQQQFESTFFNMLNVHREIKNNLELNIINRISAIVTQKEIDQSHLDNDGNLTNRINDSDYKGVQVFKLIKLDFEMLYNNFKGLNTTNGSQTFPLRIVNNNVASKLLGKRDLLNSGEKDIVELIYWEIFESYKDVVSHYCRNVYHILKFIRESEKESPKNNFRKYADIFQSQLNIDEQFILFYNFIVFNENDNSDSNLFPISIVNHYQFLENLGRNNLLDINHNNNTFYQFDIK